MPNKEITKIHHMKILSAFFREILGVIMIMFGYRHPQDVNLLTG